MQLLKKIRQVDLEIKVLKYRFRYQYKVSAALNTFRIEILFQKRILLKCKLEQKVETSVFET
jgi:hypothetical protein